MTKNILIVGGGRLAIRHAEGIKKSKYKIKLFVCDKSLKQLENLKQFLCNTKDDDKNLDIFLFTDLDKLLTIHSRFDMIIVSTTALKRSQLIQELFNKFYGKYWLIEKPLSQSLESLNQISQIHKDQKVWVNHFRRIVPWHQKIKILISKDGPLNVNVESPNLGIACNVSHFIDLVMYWTGEKPIKIDINNLETKWIASKRPSFYEINGILVIKFSSGSLLTLTSGQKSKKSFITGNSLNKSSKRFKIDEVNGIATIFENAKLTGTMPLQSTMTGHLFDGLIARETCGLTTLHEAIIGYELVIKALGEHWNTYSNKPFMKEIPIT